MKLLFATDGSRSAELALAHILDLIAAGDLPGGEASSVPEILVLTVSRPSTPTHVRPRGTLAETLAPPAAAIANLARAREALAERGLAAMALWRVGDDPAAVIVQTAVREGADLIALGCRPKSGPNQTLGSVSDGVLRASPLPVLIVKERSVSSAA